MAAAFRPPQHSHTPGVELCNSVQILYQLSTTKLTTAREILFARYCSSLQASRRLAAIVDCVHYSYQPLSCDEHTNEARVINCRTSAGCGFPSSCFGTMDPLSTTTSIIAILQLTTTLTGYINDVRNAITEQAKMAVEASTLYSLLTSLRFRVEAARSDDPWFNQVKILGTQNGPLDQFKEVLERMVEQISSSRKRDQIKSILTWKFTKSKVENTLKRIERLKSLINCVLIENLLYV